MSDEQPRGTSLAELAEAVLKEAKRNDAAHNLPEGVVLSKDGQPIKLRPPASNNRSVRGC